MVQNRSPPEVSGTECALPGPPATPASKRSDDRPPEPLNPDHRGAVLDGLEAMRQDDLADDAEIAAIYRRAGL